MTIRRLGVLATLLLLVAGCTSTAGDDRTADGDGGELGATRWVLQSMSSSGALTIVPDGVFVDADFTANRVKGFAGCNDYDAVYRNAGRMLLISVPIITRMACPEPAFSFESTYLDLLQQSRFYNVRADTLTIRGPDASVLLVFTAAPANPLLGSWVVDSYASAPGTVTAPLPGSNLTVAFGLNKVGGSSGCNTFTGPYTTNGSVAAIGPLATTRMACADDLMTQETAFLAALQGVARVENRGTTLMLQDRNGGTAVALIRPAAIPVPSASPSASAVASATAKPTPSVAPSASAAPTASPTPTPAPTPTAVPTGTPKPTATAAPPGTPAPTVKPPSSVPPTATCTITVQGTVTFATIVYPAAWNTLTAPPNLACRYFDPNPITVPADPSTLVTAVMIKGDAASTYADALAAATNPTAWNVLVNQPVTSGGGASATRIEATATAGSPGVAVGQTRYGYLVDTAGKPVWIETVGTLGSATYTTNVDVVNLIASQSSIVKAVPYSE